VTTLFLNAPGLAALGAAFAGKSGVGAIVHGFSTRAGGDDLAGFAKAASLPEPICAARQVHGAAVVTVTDPTTHDATVEADALVTATRGVTVAVRTADCVPVLLADPMAGVVAAVHAGWRGVAQGVVVAAVARMAELGAQPEGLVAALGPCITRESFEVGPEVVSELRAAGLAAGWLDATIDDGRWLAAGPGDRLHVDLHVLLTFQLASTGTPREQVEQLSRCTVREPALFHSYRRDGAAAGRQLNAIALR